MIESTIFDRNSTAVIQHVDIFKLKWFPQLWFFPADIHWIVELFSSRAFTNLYIVLYVLDNWHVLFIAVLQHWVTARIEVINALMLKLLQYFLLVLKSAHWSCNRVVIHCLVKYISGWSFLRESWWIESYWQYSLLIWLWRWSLDTGLTAHLFDRVGGCSYP